MSETKVYKLKEKTNKLDYINLGKITMQMSFWKGSPFKKGKQGGKVPLLPVRRKE